MPRRKKIKNQSKIGILAGKPGHQLCYALAKICQKVAEFG
jgi:hypothetical protein